MLQDAGFKESDIPNDWKGFWSFWCDKVQPALRAKGQRRLRDRPSGERAGVRHVLQLPHVHERVRRAGRRRDGKLHARPAEEQGRPHQGARRLRRDREEGLLAGLLGELERRRQQPQLRQQDDGDDAQRDHLDPGRAVRHDEPRDLDRRSRRRSARVNYYEKIRTRGFPEKATGGTNVPQLAAVKTAVVFADAKNKAARQGVPRVLPARRTTCSRYVEGSLGRWVPVTKRASVAPFWTDGKDPHRKAVQQQVSQGIVFFPFVYNWKFTIVNAENVWGRATARIAKDGVAAGEGGRRADRAGQADTRAVARAPHGVPGADATRAARTDIHERSRSSSAGAGPGAEAGSLRRDLLGDRAARPLLRRLRAVRRLPGPLRHLARLEPVAPTASCSRTRSSSRRSSTRSSSCWSR